MKSNGIRIVRMNPFLQFRQKAFNDATKKYGPLAPENHKEFIAHVKKIKKEAGAIQ